MSDKKRPEPTPNQYIPNPDYTKRDPGQAERIKPRDQLPTEPPQRPPRDRK
jgi:hypothetical protein